jgi:hypothetical protein
VTGAAQMLTVWVPLAVRKRGGRKLLLTPGGTMNRGPSGADSTLVRALALSCTRFPWTPICLGKPGAAHRELGLPMFKLEQWRHKAEAALDGALKEREADPADGQLGAAMQRVGELSMEVELLRARLERPGPLGRRRSR